MFDGPEYCRRRKWLPGGVLLSVFAAFGVLVFCSGPSAGTDTYEACPSEHAAPIAIFIEPTDKEIEAMKKEGEEDFYIIADDALYYQWQAIESLKKMMFPVCFTEDERHVFTERGSKKKFSVQKTCAGWCLLLWNGTDEPIWTNAVDLFMHESYLKKAAVK